MTTNKPEVEGAVYDKFAALNVVYPEDAWSAARDAYLREGGK